jgi:hypothetical protein
VGQLDLHFTDAALAHVGELMRGRESGALPAIFFASRSYECDANGTLVRDEPAHWYLSFYSKAQVEQWSETYAANGHSLVYNAQGLVVCIPQSQLLAELTGRTLDVQDRRVCIS